uniref:Adenosine 3'-phospho 5'-phosphosulfate transporter 1 n=3 Tax=Meloidogyne TaxID=189290 RepID=A0A914KWJ4_MELIC
MNSIIFYFFYILTPFIVNCAPFLNISSSNFLSNEDDLHWIFRLLPILIGYGFLIFFCFYLIRWVEKKSKDNDSFLQQNFFLRFLRLFALGQPEYKQLPQQNLNKNKSIPPSFSLRRKRKSFFEDAIYFSIFFIGIQFCLVCMGFYQERIITQPYKIQNITKKEFFKDAQFLVFANRLVALILAGIYILFRWKSLPVHVPPLYLHSFTSFSNVLSSWCQYEALKYVSFPTQTVCKASKLVPTMIMGRIVRKRQYSIREYILAFIIVFGASIFFLSSTSQIKRESNDKRREETNSAVSGFILMCGYLLLDAFTPNWQKKLFEQPPRLHTSQMMFAVNLFSVILCLISLLQQGTLLTSINFIYKHENIFVDCLLLSLGSAFGQVFILMTVKRFGPVVLSLLMTIRQILSIFFSTYNFGHSITLIGFFGLFTVFGAIIVDIYSKYRINTGRRLR